MFQRTVAKWPQDGAKLARGRLMAADSRTGSKQDAQGEIEPRKRGRSGRHYTETEIETGVFALAMASGSPPERARP